MGGLKEEEKIRDLVGTGQWAHPTAFRTFMLTILGGSSACGEPRSKSKEALGGVEEGTPSFARSFFTPWSPAQVLSSCVYIKI